MKEKISTLLDDELDIKSTSHTVSEIMKDKRLRERFEAYQLIRDAMKNELSDATLSSQSILDAIDKEPIQIQFNHHKKFIWLLFQHITRHWSALTFDVLQYIHLEYLVQFQPHLMCLYEADSS